VSVLSGVAVLQAGAVKRTLEATPEREGEGQKASAEPITAEGVRGIFPQG
jgi:hypothetical protein